TEIDFVIASNAIAGMVKVSLDWSAPHRPHASMCIELCMPGQRDKALHLPNFPVIDRVEDCQLPADLPAPSPIEILGQDFTEDPMSVRFGVLSQWYQASMYPDEKAGLWLRIESWMNAIPKAGVRVTANACQKVIEQLQFEEEDPSIVMMYRAELLAHLTGDVPLPPAKEDFFRNLATKAQHDHQAEDKERYQLWLEGAMVKGMRPLYRAIRSHEQVLTRPFQNKEAALRPYLRYHQWEEIWQSSREPAEACLPDLRAQAVEEARRLPPITVDALRTKLQCLPEKAPGQARLHGQWRIVKFALLPKKVEIERPIGLCNVVYKAWLQVRYSLVSAWLRQYAQRAPWDAAKPGSTCLCVAVHRVFQSELGRATLQSRVTCYLDLTTFYETISHQRLAQAAKELAYPATLLNVAIQVYRGARVLVADSSLSPATFSHRGVVAGCPIAPSLSKLALHEPCERLSATGLITNLDTWIDDISIDVADADADHAADRTVRAYRLLAASLGQEELVLSQAKSAFVCSDKVTEKRLRALLRPGDPPILSLVRDLGVDSAAARRRRVANSNARLAKARGRSGKLAKLKVETSPWIGAGQMRGSVWQSSYAHYKARGEFLPAKDVFYGTDASGGPRGSDPRLRVVSWAVVAIRLHPGSEGAPEYEVLGTMTGTLQIGATVNEGESVALDQLAARLRTKANVAVDSKIAIKWCHASGNKQPRPDIWTTSEEDRELLQLSWTKGHLTKQEHAVKFGHDHTWAWLANNEADRLSGHRSEEVFSYEQAERTDAIDRAAKGRAAWLGKRCSHILKNDPVPKRSEDCGLYAQQTDPVDTVKFVLQHPCRGRAAAPGLRPKGVWQESAKELAEPALAEGKGKPRRSNDEKVHAKEVNATRPPPPKAKRHLEEEGPGATAKAKGAPPNHSPIQVESEEEAPAEASSIRGEVLPRSAKERLQAIFAKAKSSPLTPHDKEELTLGEPSTPWARRVKLRSEPQRAEPGPSAGILRPRSQAEGELPILHGHRVGAGVPRNILMALPKTLGFESDQGGPSGPLLEFLGKGQDRVAYMSQDMVLKLSQHSQKQELTLAKLLPGIAAPVFWVENVMVVLHDDKGGMQNIAMTCLCQQPVIKAVEVMEARGAVFSFRFLCHVGCILTWLWTQKLHLLDLGESNMGMEQASTAEAYPALRFFDLLSWQRQSKPDAKWHGYHALAQKVCPVHAKWIKAACSEVTRDAPKVFRLFAAECQGYRDRLVQVGVMVDGELSPRQIF
ncbi:unnamed protein product, partial [Symbiodinium microadriaticum]